MSCVHLRQHFPDPGHHQGAPLRHHLALHLPDQDPEHSPVKVSSSAVKNTVSSSQTIFKIDEVFWALIIWTKPALREFLERAGRLEKSAERLLRDS